MSGLNFVRRWHGGCVQVHLSDRYRIGESGGMSPTLVNVKN